MTNQNYRIGPEDTLISSITNLVEGNIGAIEVCMDLAENNLINLLTLDDRGIYGPRIWLLYKDVCGESISKVLLLLETSRNGLLSSKFLDAMIDGEVPSDQIKSTFDDLGQPQATREKAVVSYVNTCLYVQESRDQLELGHGCSMCGNTILADTEDFEYPLCDVCFEQFKYDFNKPAPSDKRKENQ